jgi:hypothetical protein
VPCYGARRQNKVLDVVSAAILGGVAAENILFSGRGFLRSAGRDCSAIPPIDLNIAHFGIKNVAIGHKIGPF